MGVDISGQSPTFTTANAASSLSFAPTSPSLSPPHSRLRTNKDEEEEEEVEMNMDTKDANDSSNGSSDSSSPVEAKTTNPSLPASPPHTTYATTDMDCDIEKDCTPLTTSMSYDISNKTEAHRGRSESFLLKKSSSTSHLGMLMENGLFPQHSPNNNATNSELDVKTKRKSLADLSSAIISNATDRGDTITSSSVLQDGGGGDDVTTLEEEDQEGGRWDSDSNRLQGKPKRTSKRNLFARFTKK